MDNKNVFFTYTKDESGMKISKVCFVEGDKIVTEEFSAEKHGELFKEFLAKNNFAGDTLVSELEEKGLFDEDTLDEEKLTKFVNSIEVSTPEVETSDDEPSEVDPKPENNEEEETTNVYDTEDDYTEEEEKEPTIYDTDDDYIEEEKNHSGLGKRVLTGALAAGSIIAILSLAHSCQKEQKVDENQNEQQETLQDLLNKMNPEQREFFSSSFKAVETFNGRTTEDGTFKKYDDNTSLHMTVDEAVALNMILNDYNADDLQKVFGTVNYKASDVMDLARSAYSKLTTYYMNATKPSGVAEMITDADARAFFERHESAVIDFNNNPTTEKSDVVIKGLYYDYVYGGTNGEYASIQNNGVAWLATSSGFGFELANRNVEEFLKVNEVTEEEQEKYGLAAATVGMPLSKVTDSELLTGINEEINIDVMDEIDNKSLCASVTKDVTETIGELTSMQQMKVLVAEEYAREALIEGLKDAGEMSLANKVMNSEITDDLLKEISTANADANELVDEYNSRISSLVENENSIMHVMDVAREQYDSKELVDIADLVNNRFRTALVLERDDNTLTEEEQKKEDLYVGKDESGKDIYDGDKLNELPKDEKDQFIKDNGEVVGKTEETTKTEKVEKDELTKDEVDKVVSEEAILAELDVIGSSLKISGIEDANEYTEEKGAYKYSGDIVIKWNSQKIDTEDMTLAKIAQFSYAFEGKEITSSDKQIQNRMDEDAKKVENQLNSLSDEAKEYLKDKYGSDWKEEFINETYKEGYTASIKATLESAKKQGLILREETEKIYLETKQEIDQNIPTIEDQNKDDYDSNLDSGRVEEGEIPYVSTPAYYVSDAELEDAFSDMIGESTKTK